MSANLVKLVESYFKSFTRKNKQSKMEAINKHNSWKAIRRKFLPLKMKGKSWSLMGKRRKGIEVGVLKVAMFCFGMKIARKLSKHWQWNDANCAQCLHYECKANILWTKWLVLSILNNTCDFSVLSRLSQQFDLTWKSINHQMIWKILIVKLFQIRQHKVEVNWAMHWR